MTPHTTSPMPISSILLAHLTMTRRYHLQCEQLFWLVTFTKTWKLHQNMKALPKGYLNYSQECGYSFRKMHDPIGLTIPTLSLSLSGFRCTWTTLRAEGQLLLGDATVSFFLKSPTLFHPPIMSLLNTLIYPWLSSLIKALHPDNPDHNNWLYYDHKEKGG
jgi:hypothetical protein